jgi:hypothetical protein
MKKYIITVLCLIQVLLANTQPSAPTVNGLGYAKFVEFPISPFTGTFSYSVPIGTVTSGSLSLPVSIDYHSGGNKVGDPASNVGLGWNLNYGGSITRTIIGVRDEEIGDGYLYDPTPNTISANYFDVAEQKIDGEPDIFTWTAGGQGGKFYIDRNQNIVHITKTNAKVEIIGPDNDLLNIKSLLRFLITINDGTKYHFRERNTQTPEAVQTTIEWLLTKVVSFDGLDSIAVNHHGGGTYELYKTKTIGMPIKYGTNPSNLITTNSNETSYTIHQKTIDKIIGTNNSILFQYATRQDLQAYYQSSSPTL